MHDALDHLLAAAVAVDAGLRPEKAVALVERDGPARAIEFAAAKRNWNEHRRPPPVEGGT